MPPAAQEAQYSTIRTTTFYDNTQTKLQEIIDAMTSKNFRAKGEIISEVDGVPISFRHVSEHDAELKVGHSGAEGADYFYSWRIPLAWVMPAMP